MNHSLADLNHISKENAFISGMLMSAAILFLSSVALGKVLVPDLTVQTTFFDWNPFSEETIGDVINSCDHSDAISFHFGSALTCRIESTSFVRKEPHGGLHAESP